MQDTAEDKCLFRVSLQIVFSKWDCSLVSHIYHLLASVGSMCHTFSDLGCCEGTDKMEGSEGMDLVSLLQCVYMTCVVFLGLSPPLPYHTHFLHHHLQQHHN